MSEHWTTEEEYALVKMIIEEYDWQYISYCLKKGTGSIYNKVSTMINQIIDSNSKYKKPKDVKMDNYSLIHTARTMFKINDQLTDLEIKLSNERALAWSLSQITFRD